MIGKPQYYYYRWTWLVIMVLVVMTTTMTTTTSATTVLSSPQEQEKEENEQVRRRRRLQEQDQILPIWVTRQELNHQQQRQQQQKQHDKDEWRDLRQQQRPSFTTSSTTTSTPRRFPAEWEPVDRILLARGLGATTTSGGGALWRALVEITTAVTDAAVPIWMAAGPDDMTTTTTTTTTTNDLEVLSLYSNAPDTPVNSVWIRDYGPISVWEENNSNNNNNNNNSNNNDESAVSLVMVDFAYGLGEFRKRDDAMACDWLSGNEWYANVPCETTALVMDGGNLLTDGAGNLFMTDITYDWNAPHWTRDQVDDALKQLLGVQHIHALPYARDPIYRDFPADGTGHIDMFVKLMGPCTVIIAETADPVFRDTMQAAVEYFANLNCRGRQGDSSAGGGRRPGNTSSSNGGRGRGRRFSGRGLRQRRPSSGAQEPPPPPPPQEPAEPYTIYRVPAWVNYRDASYPYWVTYANSLFIGKNLILVPSYDGGPNDKVHDIYQQAVGPDTTVVMIDSDYVIRLGGAIHCLTMQIPALPASAAAPAA